MTIITTIISPTAAPAITVVLLVEGGTIGVSLGFAEVIAPRDSMESTVDLDDIVVLSLLGVVVLRVVVRRLLEVVVVVVSSVVVVVVLVVVVEVVVGVEVLVEAVVVGRSVVERLERIRGASDQVGMAVVKEVLKVIVVGGREVFGFVGGVVSVFSSHWEF